MPRVEPLKREDLPQHESTFVAIEDALGVLPNSTLTMARRPRLMAAFAELNAAVMYDGEVDGVLKQMVAAMVSSAAGCAYCHAHTSHVAERRGADQAKVEALYDFETSDLFSDAERAALRVAHGAGCVPNAVTDEDMAALKEHYTEDEIVELVSVMANFGFLNRWNDTMATELERSPFAWAEEHLAPAGWTARRTPRPTRPSDQPDPPTRHHTGYSHTDGWSFGRIHHLSIWEQSALRVKGPWQQAANSATAWAAVAGEANAMGDIKPPEGADDQTAVQVAADGIERDPADYNKSGKLKRSVYDDEMARLHEQLVLLQYWIQSQGLKVLVIFEGRGSAGKGGVIKRITERTSPRTVKVVALPKPTERQRTQWYFQRYVEHLPAAGEMVLFDRSWYNRSNVEWVMGYVSPEEHQEFLRSCPEFERMLVRSGIVVIKYWFSVSFEEQRQRFEARNAEPLKRWKLSDMDLAEHELYVRYSMAKDTTFTYTDIKQAPWYVVPSDDKRAARLNCISHLLSQFDYVDVAPDEVQLPEMADIPYVRPPMHEQTFVPARF